MPTIEEIKETKNRVIDDLMDVYNQGQMYPERKLELVKILQEEIRQHEQINKD